MSIAIDTLSASSTSSATSGLVELTAWVALANQYTRVNTALGIEAQGFAAACGLAPLAQPSGVASRA